MKYRKYGYGQTAASEYSYEDIVDYALANQCNVNHQDEVSKLAFSTLLFYCN